MKRQKLEIGHPAAITVLWYDDVPEPKKNIWYDGEIIGWRDSQVIVRVKDYAVLRFWKTTGVEVGNGDHQRRGFKVDLKSFSDSTKPIEIPIEIAIDTNL